MWWRFLTFCLLVSLILVLVLSYIHDRPVVHLFFKRRPDDNIDGEVIFENFANNFLKERMVAFEVIESNGTFVPTDIEVEEMMDELRKKLNVHSPDSRRTLEDKEDRENDISVNDVETDENGRRNSSEFGRNYIVDSSDNLGVGD